MTIPIGIYVRVSAKGDREDERFHSPREQAERAIALASAKGYVPGPVFQDINVSGGTAPQDRPQMARLLAAIDAGELAGIAAFSLDRLSREPAHGDALVKRVTKAGGVLLTPDIPDALDSPTGEFTFGMLLQVAKLYRSQARARFASAKERAILKGIPVGDTPLGYRLRPDRVMEVDPAEAAVVHRLYEMRSRGAGSTALAEVVDEYLAGTERPDRQGRKPYTPEGMRALIRNRLYATGRLTYGEFVSEVEAGAIVDEPLWHAAQAPTPTPRRPRTEGRWLLTGLLRCAGCGSNLKPSTTRSYRNYRCANRLCASKACVSASRIEAWAVHWTLAVEHELVARSETPDLSALQEELAIAERRLAQVMADGAADDLGELWAPEVRRRREARDAAATALGEAQAAAGLASALEFQIGDVWDDLGPLDRRAAIQLFWKEIRVGRKASGGGTPVKFVARGAGVEVEVAVEG
jgi:DNA invertase Pin-like site-specific DNA recombinase